MIYTSRRPKKNIRVRNHLYNKRIYLWELAEALGISASGLGVKMRTEQPEDIQELWIQTIDRIAQQNAVS